MAQEQMEYERVEFSLDNRQILFLLFGLVVVAGFVFFVGVLVGRRMSHAEQQTWLAESSSASGVLPASIHGWNDGPGGGGPVGEPGDEAAGDAAAGSQRDPSGVDAKLRAQGWKGAGDEGRASEPDFAYVEGVAKNDAAKLPKTRPAGVAPRNESKVKAERAKVEAAQRARESKVKHGDFTLQLKRFDDEGEAKSLAARVKKSGYKAKIVPSERGGKLHYVVTVGDYATWDDAIKGKASFEAKVGIVAYAARQ